MRLDYNILWIEDDQEWLETTKELFEGELEDLGFRLNPTIMKDGDIIDDLIAQNGFSDFDLIMVDFKLQNSQTGNTIIQKIRDNTIFTEVLFYSQDIDLVKNSVREQDLEGVYTANRNDIEEKFLKVMQTTIKKVQEVNTMRGLIVAETSILDDRSLQIIRGLLKEGTEASTLLSKYIFECIEAFFVKKNEDFSSYKEADNIIGLIEDNMLFGAYQRAKALQKIGKIKGIEELNKFTDRYTQDVIRVRNVFAHAKEVKEDGISRLKGSDTIIDHDSCVAIRKSLMEYSNLFDRLEQTIIT